MSRASAAAKARTKALFVEGVIADGRLDYPTMSAIASQCGVGERSISRWSGAEGWLKLRSEYQLAFKTGAVRQRLVDLMLAAEKSLSTDISMATVVQNLAIRMAASYQNAEATGVPTTPLSPAEGVAIARMLEIAQRIRRLAMGESTSIITRRSDAEAEMDEAKRKAEGGPLSMTEDEEVAALEELRNLPGVKLLKALGMTASLKPRSLRTPPERQPS